MKRLILGLSLLCAFEGACVSATTPEGYPLYPHASGTLPPEQTALLMGAVATVDGERVGRFGRAFALLPGCHVIENQQNWGGADANSAATAHFPAYRFSIPMRAGYHYVIDIAQGAGNFVQLSATERDASGQIVNSFEPGGSCSAG
ncbi:MAG TPA: hypothetical protein VHV51_08235 [Polyangiaceae bacterium]|jgi:hypothetical protein|nr:hypothetical protein [Polyangiaceae bacterium]